jgi:hypothetical protein
MFASGIQGRKYGSGTKDMGLELVFQNFKIN